MLSRQLYVVVLTHPSSHDLTNGPAVELARRVRELLFAERRRHRPSFLPLLGGLGRRRFAGSSAVCLTFR